MKVVILAGGFGTRISEESYLKPKPMIEIGERPILWHIMKYYSHFGFHDFIICLGYKGYAIKQFFTEYFLHTSDITINLENNDIKIHDHHAEPWKVTMIDTGLNTMTGGRIKRIQEYVENEDFMLTYGDGVANIDLNELLSFHRSHGRIATMTAVQPGGKFGALEIQDKDNSIRSFREKTKEDGGWINGGYMVLKPEVFNYIEGDSTIFERDPLETLAQQNQLVAYKHTGFWQCMDTLRDKQLLDSLLENKKAPWKVW